MSNRITYNLIGKNILATVGDKYYRTVLKKQKVIKLIGEEYGKNLKSRRGRPPKKIPTEVHTSEEKIKRVPFLHGFQKNKPVDRNEAKKFDIKTLRGV